MHLPNANFLVGSLSAALRAVWRPSLYISLIRGAVARGDSDLGLHVLGEMRRWGFFVGSKAYEHLFQLVQKPSHLSSYLPVSNQSIFQWREGGGGSELI